MLGNKQVIYRVKSDNYDCYMTKAAYDLIKLEFSSGDYGSHRAIELELYSHQREKTWERGFPGLIDVINEDPEDHWTVTHYAIYKDGDCWYEPIGEAV